MSAQPTPSAGKRETGSADKRESAARTPHGGAR